MINVLVLMGGLSEEREVSLRSGAGVYDALKKVGYQAKTLDLSRENLGKIKDISPDVVFIALHGKYGEDGTVQGYLDILGIPYTGSGVETSAICINKGTTKKIFAYEGIPTADFVIITQYEYRKKQLDLTKTVSKLGLPLVVKAATQGSSIGVYIVKTPDELKSAIEEAFKYDQEVVIEKFIEGPQLTVAIIGNEEPQVLPIIEITAANEFYDYEAKYTPGMCEHIIPARVSESVHDKVIEISKKVYTGFRCRGYARIDFMIDKDENPYVLEINTIPGMTSMSLVPDAARAAGIKYEELVDKIVCLALRK
ncbi:d-alanine--d-alanine ligase [hydrocarbon metagenome]|uniref:D-alanine--d-alanine ligase n=1 Tax=hydrocarbon metagenome TaxID=938273 RepID=A0A0W8E6Y0_9ZZZZ